MLISLEDTCSELSLVSTGDKIVNIDFQRNLYLTAIKIRLASENVSNERTPYLREYQRRFAVSPSRQTALSGYCFQ